MAENAFTVSGKKKECCIATARLNCVCAAALHEIGKLTSPSRSSAARAIVCSAGAISAEMKSSRATRERVMTRLVPLTRGG
jgi:hypothetical protein